MRASLATVVVCLAAATSAATGPGRRRISGGDLTTRAAVPSGIKGFNYGSQFNNQQAKLEADFAYEFKRAQNLPGTSGWTSARLYSMVQWGTANDPIQAIPAAMATNTRLLLGMWLSGGPQAFENELAALQKAISTYGTAFTSLVDALSVGSEDLFRDANPQALEGPGTSAAYIVDCIARTRQALAGTPLAGVALGHVDTYDSFFNATNSAVIPAVDFLGFDGYPFWEQANANAITDAKDLFFKGLEKTKAIANGKPVFVTETGWPTRGKTVHLAVPSPENARTYWTDVACALTASKVNFWWFTLQQSQYGQADPDFGLFPAGDLNTVTPSYDLSC